MFVECPACEEQFQIPPEGLGRKQTCPGCERSFQPQQTISELRTRTEETSVGEFSESISQTMEPRTTRNRGEANDAQFPKPPAQTESQVIIESSPDEIQLAVPPDPNVKPWFSPPDQSPSNLSVSGQHQGLSSRINTRKTTRSPLIMGLMAVIGLVAIFGVVFVAINQLSRTAAAPDDTSSDKSKAALANSSNTDTTPDALTPTKTSSSKRSSPGGKKTGDTDKNTISSEETKPLPEETPETYTLKEFDKVWSKVYSYMVRLDIKTPSGMRQASGMIIDSRGWVATSYLAIKDATEINVVLASREFDNGRAWREQSDKSYGIVSTDAPRDLAIIAINRDLVLSFTDIKIDPDQVVVQGNRMILARTPTPARRLWLTEVRIDERKKFADFADDIKTQLQNDESRDVFERWLLHSLSVEDQFRGAPLLNKNGEVVAINSSLKATGTNKGFSLPIKHLLALKQQSNEEITPFGRNTPNFADPSTTDATTDATPETPLIETSKFAEIDDLKKSFGTCREFRFVGRDVEEVEQVELFVERLNTALDLSVDTNLELADRDELADECEKIMRQTERVVAGFGGELTRRIAEMNDMMLLELDSEQPVPVALICNVVKGAASSPVFDGKPTVSLEAQGTGQMFFVSLNDDTIVMPPGKTMMLFGRTDPKTLLSSGGIDRMKINLLFGTEIRDYGGQ